MPLLVTSAAGANGDGYGALLAFDADGAPLGAFSTDSRIADPRGLGVDRERGLLFVNSGSDRVLAFDRQGRVVRDTGPIAGLNPGGGNFGPDGRYYVGLRGARSIMAFEAGLEGAGALFLLSGVVPFPRGFAFGRDGRLFLASGIGPTGEGDDAILAFDSAGRLLPTWRVTDPALSPLDLTLAPNGNIVVTSEHPFGAPDAITTIREYDAADGHLVRVFSSPEPAAFRKPRGLRFGPDGRLYGVARDEVIALDFASGRWLGAVVAMPRLNGQALIFFP
jgi:sugar lactone lactonase YvrE